MKNSKLLRGICYVIVPILVANLILSICYIVITENSTYNDEKSFFTSYNFIYNYLDYVRDRMERLIYMEESDGYKTVKDGEKTIYYDGVINMYGIDNFMNYIIIYKNKVVTNVRFSESTDTFEEIKAYVLENKQNNLCYENGEITSNVKEYVSGNNNIYYNMNNYLDCIKTKYYTINNGLEVEAYESRETEALEEVPETYSDDQDTVLMESPTREIQYYTAYAKDFNFYTSFNPDLEDKSSVAVLINTLTMVKPYETIISISIPVSAILLLIISIYLLNSIGHIKGKDEIQLTDFDKVPLEVIIFLFFIVCAITIGIIQEQFYEDISMNASISVVVTLYVINAVVTEALLITTIARIKAKKFLDTCICGKLFKFAMKVLKGLWKKGKEILKNSSNQLKKAKKSLNENVNLTWKIIIFMSGYIIIGVFLIGIFGPFGAMIDLAAFIYIMYEVIVRINSFKKLEESLKKIYEGEKVTLYNSDFSNEFEQCVEYINDISNGFENAVQESLKSERLKTELITNVSHDIKTPLTSIINYVDLIKKENVDNEKIKEYIEILDNKSQRLKNLTEDLVEASKASSGNINLNLEEIRIVELLNQALGEYKDKFEARNLEVISNLEKGNIKIKADSRHIYRVIENLFGNISKYALENSRVYVETKVKNQNVTITFKNISKDRLNISEEELMQRFVRGDKSRTTEGSGLGLAIARSLTELQGGTLNCKIDGDLFKVELEFKTI